MTAHCPHCGKIITPEQAASLLRISKITDKSREASRKNGKGGGYWKQKRNIGKQKPENEHDHAPT